MPPRRPELSVVVVPTSRLGESIVFYRDGIGLELVEEWDAMGRGALIQASETGQIELIELDDVADSPEPRTGIGLQVRGVDEIHARLKALGASIKAPPRVRAWGMYGFGVLDPNGVPVNIYEPANA